MKSRSPTGGLVYSTEGGRMCPACRRPLAQCSCSKAAPPPPSDGIVRVLRESKGRGGKAVTVVRGAPGDAAALARLGQELKTACGCGGTVKDGTIEVQGDHVDKVMAWLQQRGHKVKRAGG
ncbi:translation initiation factor Sui1 [Ramlibacter sp. AN1133]|uniref:translation initiation factor Sui1 n=1 Tax=Ramlibacter sp. AN1133 TaxID=3133429 RepID=UPI0030BAA375